MTLQSPAQFVLTHPYANAFGPPDSAKLFSSNDNADWIYPPAPGVGECVWSPRPKADYSSDIPNDGVTVFEAKWEVDSLANFFRLAATLAKASNRTDFVRNRTWRMAAQMALSALKSQQRTTKAERDSLKESLKGEDAKASERDGRSGLYSSEEKGTWWANLFHLNNGNGVKQSSRPSVLSSEWDRRFEPLAGGLYRFRRQTRSASETKSEDGFGEPVKYTGMIKSAFRPSDDATILPFFVPGNA